MKLGQIDRFVATATDEDMVHGLVGAGGVGKVHTSVDDSLARVGHDIDLSILVPIAFVLIAREYCRSNVIGHGQHGSYFIASVGEIFACCDRARGVMILVIIFVIGGQHQSTGLDAHIVGSVGVAAQLLYSIARTELSLVLHDPIVAVRLAAAAIRRIKLIGPHQSPQFTRHLVAMVTQLVHLGGCATTTTNDDDNHQHHRHQQEAHGSG